MHVLLLNAQRKSLMASVTARSELTLDEVKGKNKVTQVFKAYIS